jgi:peptidoglycan/LPS O-acetylase OafA/YrhL
MEKQKTSSQRNYSLEALRGLTAIIVVLWHTCLAFFPEYTTTRPSTVIIFFVLSGFVLTQRTFIDMKYDYIVNHAIKRYFRLVFMVFIGLFISFMLFKFNLYSFKEAGHLNQSSWLSSFAGAETIPDGNPIRFIIQALYGVFFNMDNYNYDPPLWTMHIEFYGSFIIFGFTFLFIEILKFKRIFLTIIFITITCLAIFNINIFFLPMMVGVLFSYITTSYRFSEFLKMCVNNIYTVIPLIIFAFYCFMDLASIDYIPDHLDPIYLNILGALLFVIVFYYNNITNKIFNNKLGAFLGKYSFPMYIIHVLIICSIGSYIYVHLYTYNVLLAKLVAILCIFIVSMGLCYLMNILDKKWNKLVNKLFY